MVDAGGNDDDVAGGDLSTLTRLCERRIVAWTHNRGDKLVVGCDWSDILDVAGRHERAGAGHDVVHLGHFRVVDGVHRRARPGGATTQHGHTEVVFPHIEDLDFAIAAAWCAHDRLNLPGADDGRGVRAVALRQDHNLQQREPDGGNSPHDALHVIPPGIAPPDELSRPGGGASPRWRWSDAHDLRLVDFQHDVELLFGEAVLP